MQVALLLGLTATLTGGPAAPPPASAPADALRVEALARTVEAHHASVTDLKARFVQTYVSSLLGREITERGTVAIKRPDRMLWKYEAPEEKVFVSDGQKSYFYVPADHQVIVQEARTEQSVALQLLSGKSGLFSEFQVLATPGTPLGLTLVPRKANAEVRQITLEATPQGAIRVLDIVDLAGNRSRFRLEDVKENVGLSDHLFEFKIPRGVEVVTG